jgi:hypothetical protein
MATDSIKSAVHIPSLSHFVDSVADCPKLHDSLDRPCRPTPCSTCPFRKTDKPWIDVFQWVINVFRVRQERVQDCHCDSGTRPRICAGIVVCLAGGSEEIHSVQEFERIRSASLAGSAEEAIKRYEESANAANMDK